MELVETVVLSYGSEVVLPIAMPRGAFSRSSLHTMFYVCLFGNCCSHAETPYFCLLVHLTFLVSCVVKKELEVSS